MRGGGSCWLAVLGFLLGPLFESVPRKWRAVGAADAFENGKRSKSNLRMLRLWLGQALRVRPGHGFAANAMASSSPSRLTAHISDARCGGFRTPSYSCVPATEVCITKMAPSPQDRRRDRLTRYPVRVNQGQVEILTTPDPYHLRRYAILRKAWEWFDARTDASKVIGPILKHPVPPRTGWMYVFGSATLFAFLIQVFTGIALATAYVSSAGQAYESLQWITHQAFLGHLLRGMHYFGASAMVLLVGIHMIRTFLTGSYKFPRELNWVVGVLLLGLTILMGFTGQCFDGIRTGFGRPL